MTATRSYGSPAASAAPSPTGSRPRQSRAADPAASSAADGLRPVAAVFELHGQTRAPSTRYKDLVDVVAILLAAPVGAESQMAALRSEAERRGLRLPGHFTVPDRQLWGARLPG